MRRATKIVATLGPASSDPALLEQMIRAGVNVVRLNFSHGVAQDHIDRARLVREADRAGATVVEQQFAMSAGGGGGECEILRRATEADEQ
eukprot:gene20434-25047_t